MARIGGRSFRLFHPRRDRWHDHFMLRDDCLVIKGMTDIGIATEGALSFNSLRHNGPLAVRHRAILDGIYPPAWARGWSY